MKNYIQFLHYLLKNDDHICRKIYSCGRYSESDINKLLNLKNKPLPQIVKQFYLKFGRYYAFFWLRDPAPIKFDDFAWFQEELFRMDFQTEYDKTIKKNEIFIIYKDEYDVFFINLNNNFEDPKVYYGYVVRHDEGFKIIVKKKMGWFSYFIYSSLMHKIQNKKYHEDLMKLRDNDNIIIKFKTKKNPQNSFLISKILNNKFYAQSYLGFLFVNSNKIQSCVNPEVMYLSELEEKSKMSCKWIRIDKFVDEKEILNLSHQEMDFFEDLKNEFKKERFLNKLRNDALMAQRYLSRTKNPEPHITSLFSHLYYKNSTGIFIGFCIEKNNLIGLCLESKKIEYIPKSISKLHYLRTLNLKGHGFFLKQKSGIQELPEEIGDLENLEYLELSWNYLRKLPKAIGKLKKLKYLGLNYCQLEEIPQELCNNENLEYLYLKGNKIKEIPPQLWNLKKLKTLIISENNLTELKIKDGNMNALKILDASDNCINDIDIQPDTAPNLEILNLTNNFIAEIPDSMLHLKNLADLRIVNNEIYRIPESIEYTTNLRYINLEANQIKSIPEEFTKLLKLEQFNFAFNFISEVPVNLTDLPNLKSGNLIGNNLKQPILVDVRKPKRPFIFQQANDFEEDELKQKNMVFPDDYY